MQSARAKKFLVELIELSKAHGVYLSHEDCHGAFIVEERGAESDHLMDSWLMSAMDETIPALPSADTVVSMVVPKAPLVPCIHPSPLQLSYNEQKAKF